MSVISIKFKTNTSLNFFRLDFHVHSTEMGCRQTDKLVTCTESTRFLYKYTKGHNYNKHVRLLLFSAHRLMKFYFIFVPSFLIISSTTL